MHFNMDWFITVGEYQLALLDAIEVNKSTDLLSDTCKITLPGYAHNNVIKVDKLRVEQKIKRGDKVIVNIGYDGKLNTEFEGYLLTITTDNGSIVLNCEDDLFLLRKAVANKQFKNTKVDAIASYLVQQVGAALGVRCTLNVDYDKFVIYQATAYDVLKKLQEELKANIYLRKGELNIHPPYTEQHGNVKYSFQENIEESSLQYKNANDKKFEVIVEGVGFDGNTKQVSAGVTGGDKITIKASGLSNDAMLKIANAELRRNVFDGYEGDITTWLIPYAEPGYSAEIIDGDFEYKNGRYYTKSVTTKFDSSGGVRKLQLGIKL